MNRDRVAGMESAHVWPRSPELPANTSSSFSPRKPAESHSGEQFCRVIQTPSYVYSV